MQKRTRNEPRLAESKKRRKSRERLRDKPVAVPLQKNVLRIKKSPVTRESGSRTCFYLWASGLMIPLRALCQLMWQNG